MNYSLLSRSYDLRGIYGVDIDEDFFFRLGYAFVKVTEKKRIALGYDARLSSPILKSAFTRGASLAGATIIDLGLVSSDMLSFATCHYDDIEAGGMITASHNPKEYNGFKSLAHSAEPYNLKKYGPAMVEIMESLDIPDDDISENVEYRDVSDDWVNHIQSFVGTDVDFSQLTIVADGGNGSAGAFMEKLADKFGFKLVPLYLSPDGNFPNHHPNPMLEKNRNDAKNTLIDNQADAAFIFDGDADRIMILNDQANMITSGIMSSVIAEEVAKKYPKAGFIGNATISHIFRDTVEKIGGFYEREMVGHVYIREHMMKNPAVVYAGEHSAHYFFRDNYYMDSGIMAGMVFLAAIARRGKKISEVVPEYQTYMTLEETNFEVKDPKGSIAILAEKYKNEDHDLFDGITVRYADGSWWNFRPSSNEPLLRLNMEAKTQERFDALYAEIMEHIRTFGEASED